MIASYSSSCASSQDKLYYANDEIQRMHNPLLENRRRATCPMQLGDRQIAADELEYDPELRGQPRPRRSLPSPGAFSLGLQS